MRPNTSLLAITGLVLALTSWSSFAQSAKYQRKKPAPATADAPATQAAKPDSKDAAKPAADADKSDKVDVSDLEQKYWAPKDTDFSVVQNRTYTKAGKYSVSLTLGPDINDLYSSGYNTSLAVNYFFNERYGLEFDYIKYNLSDSKSTKDFLNLSGGATYPDFNRRERYLGVGFNWVPFYAKMSVLGKKIIYFDMAFTPTLGQVTFSPKTDGNPAISSKSAVAYGFDVTQYYFLSERFSVRLDFKNSWYKEPVYGFQTGEFRKDRTAHTTLLLVGGTFFFSTTDIKNLFHRGGSQ